MQLIQAIKVIKACKILQKIFINLTNKQKKDEDYPKKLNQTMLYLDAQEL